MHSYLMPNTAKIRGSLPFLGYLAALFIYIAGNHFLFTIAEYHLRVTYYVVLWGFLSITYLFLISHLENNPIFLRFFRLTGIKRLLLLLLIAFLLRAVMLVLPPTLSTDIFFAMERSRHMLNGDTLYRDFEVNKPPAYVYMLYLMGAVMGVGDIQFRLFFVFVDVLVAFMVYNLGGILLEEKMTLRATLAYALLPLSAVEVGYSGHYDPVPTFFVLLSVYLFFRKKYRWIEHSSISLGIAFALKLFPVVLLPLFMISLKTNRSRMKYLLLFSLPMVLSLLPVVILTPHEFLGYILNEQATGCSWNSITCAITVIIGTEYQKKIEYFMLSITALSLLYLYFLFKRGWKVEYGWGVLISYLTVWMIFWNGTFLSMYLIPAPLALFISLIISGYIIIHIMPRHILPHLSGNTDHILINGLLFSAATVILGFNRLHSWYFLWLMPIALLHRDKRIFFGFLLLMTFFQPVGIDI